MSNNVPEKNLGNELIFLISQPRSGSTLLQRILGSHEDILTLPEPWLMLHTVYANKPEGLAAEYNSAYAHIALQGFLKRINRGQNVYTEATREFTLSIYRAALLGTQKSFFLDKTPRYYFIIDELLSIFPKAKFVFLLRNPVSVFASILEDSCAGEKDNWWQFVRQEDRRKDLLLAPHKIMKGIKRLGQSAITVKYEDLVLNPEIEIERICTELEVKFDTQMLEYGERTEPKKNGLGDPKNIHKHATAVNQYIDSWKSTLDTKVKTALAKAYVNLLDDDVLATYGESREELISQLAKHEKSIKSGQMVNKQEVLERLLQHGDTFDSLWERIRCTLVIQAGDKKNLSKIRWLMTKLMKSR